MSIVTWIWEAASGGQHPQNGIEFVLLVAYWLSAVALVKWVVVRVLPEVRVARRLAAATLADRENNRSPVDAAACHLLVELVVGMGARPARHEYLKNLQEDGRFDIDGQTRTGHALRIVFGVARDTAFQPAAEPSTRRTGSRLLEGAESAGMFVLGCVLFLNGVVLIPWTIVTDGELNGRAVTFLVLAHGMMQLLGRVHRATRTLDLAVGLVRPTLVLTGGFAGLFLYDLPDVLPQVQLQYAVAGSVSAMCLGILLGLLGFVASLRSDEDAQMQMIVGVIRFSATLTFLMFASVNVRAVAVIGWQLQAVEYAVFAAAHVVTAAAMAAGESQRQIRERSAV